MGGAPSSRATVPRIEIQTIIQAPIEVVFDLSRSVDLHQLSQSRHGERAVDGRTSGLIELGEWVTWEAVHFGVRQRLTSRIEVMDRPRHFRDSMVRGAFRRFDHDHQFERVSSGETRMFDLFDYTSPLGILGRLADAVFLERYMRDLLGERNRMIREVAESGRYRELLGCD